MFDQSVAFKKRGENEHLYFNGSAYASKAYLVNDEERGVILGEMNRMMRDTIGGTTFLAVLCTSDKSNLFLYVGIFLLLNAIRYFVGRKRIKKILGNREKIACEKQTVLEYQLRVVNTMSWKNIATCVFSVIMLFFAGIVCFAEYEKTGQSSNLWWAIPCFCASGLMAAFIIFQSYLKLKKRKQSI